MAIDMAFILQRFFDILLKKVGISTTCSVLCVTFLCQGFEIGEDLHSTHAMQISARLERIVRMQWDPSFEYDVLPFVRQLSNLWFNYLYSLNLKMSRVHAAEHRVYKILESISKYRGYGPAEMLQGMIPFYSIGPDRGNRVYKYHIVIMFPQLSARAIVHCTGYASLVGVLTVGHELDDLVRQMALTYINVRSLPSQLFFGPLPLACTAGGGRTNRRYKRRAL